MSSGPSGPMFLPEPFCKQVILACHDDFSHLGMEKTLGLLKDRFFWPKMSEDVKLHICSCKWCTKFKQPQEREEMKSIICTYPLELVHLDFLTIGKEGSDKNVNVLMVTDHFTWYSQHLLHLSKLLHVWPRHCGKTSWFTMGGQRKSSQIKANCLRTS